MSGFNTRFKELRESSKYTQEEIAKKLGTSRSTIGMYETGKRTPDYENLEMIADFFNVDTDYLLGRSDKTTRLPNAVSLTPNEKKLIEKYRSTDDRGRHMIDYIADVEYRRAGVDAITLAAHHEGSYTEEQKDKIREFVEMSTESDK